MKEELISFETAKLAKEKKFDWNCNYFYNKIGKLCDIQYYDSTPNNKLEEGYWFSSDEEFFCAVPTQSLLQRWLREKHNIKVFVTPSTAADDGKTITHYVCDIYSNNLLTTMTKDFNTYEQALEAGLLEGLKLIK